MKIRTLLGLFIILGTIYGITRLFSGKQERRFSANLVQIDTAKVTSILLIPQKSAVEISLLREGNAWIASNGQVHVTAQPEAVNSLLRVLTIIQTDEIVAKEPSQWTKYAVDDKQGTHVRVYEKQQLLADFILGTIDFSPNSQAAKSYLRLNGEKEVYVVNSLLAMQFSRAFNDFRNGTLLKIRADMEVTSFDYQMQDSISEFVKTNTGWKNDTLTLDSMQVEAYLNDLRNIYSQTFADDFDEVQGNKYLYKTLLIKCKNREEPIIVSCYRDTTRQPPFVLHSNQNQESFFASDSLGAYNQIFNKVNSFKKEQKSVDNRTRQ